MRQLDSGRPRAPGIGTTHAAGRSIYERPRAGRSAIEALLPRSCSQHVGERGEASEST